MSRSKPDRQSRFVGSLLGTAFGDILGAAVEGMSFSAVAESFGTVRDFLDTGRGLGRYTDDTQMTFALATSMVRCAGVDDADCARAYAEYLEPWRGYGRSAIRIVEALREGADYRQTATMFFPSGSFGNGAAMRIAPVGLAYAGAPVSTVREKVFAAIRCTHVHPEAVDGAVVQALAVGHLSLAQQGMLPDGPEFVSSLRAACEDPRMIEGLQCVEVLLRRGSDDEEAIARLKTGVRSAESVPAALWAALRYGDDPQEAIIRAVNLGGDTDTIGAMCGALVGALHGDGWFPARWYDKMENGRHGRDALIDLAVRLARLGIDA
ncbi:MAG: hypothetical protein GWO11_07540 [Desulfuromonadales bacterium]|nr:hypothetical protein [Desulfuromonadales bacterium]NIR34174.1 hypothetical protein [Desulfuromonadales bacterium]NIS40318.1 hypothetical protein [Desulfuromonadales bacterium]